MKIVNVVKGWQDKLVKECNGNTDEPKLTEIALFEQIFTEFLLSWL